MNLESLPINHQAVIPDSYLDEMNHMNVMWYTHLFSQATCTLFRGVGLTLDYFTKGQAGTFALECHVRYLAEVRVGKHVTIRSRVLGRSAKRIHFMHFMIRDDGDVLSATAEYVATHTDMTVRRSAPFPRAIADEIDRLLAEHQALAWDSPLCGKIKS